MKYVQKVGDGPEKFLEWISDNQCRILGRECVWDDITTEAKSALRESLVVEQGYICCYCGDSVAENTCEIEHLKPQSAYPDSIFDYQNLLASCKGGAQDPNTDSRELHCNRHKGDWYDEELMVSPLNRECESYFSYALDGQVHPGTDPAMSAAAKESISRLNLNCGRLQRLREEAITAR